MKEEQHVDLSLTGSVIFEVMKLSQSSIYLSAEEDKKSH